MQAVGRRAGGLHLGAVGAAGVRTRAVLVAGGARSTVPVVAVLSGTELVDRTVLAPTGGVERTRGHVEADGSPVRVRERPAHILAVLAAAAPASAAGRAEGGLHLERLALASRVGARVERGLELPDAAARPQD